VQRVSFFHNWVAMQLGKPPAATLPLHKAEGVQDKGSKAPEGVMLLEHCDSPSCMQLTAEAGREVRSGPRSES
jgi:hypothetical protein